MWALMGSSWGVGLPLRPNLGSGWFWLDLVDGFVLSERPRRPEVVGYTYGRRPYVWRAASDEALASAERSTHVGHHGVWGSRSGRIWGRAGFGSIWWIVSS